MTYVSGTTEVYTASYGHDGYPARRLVPSWLSTLVPVMAQYIGPVMAQSGPVSLGSVWTSQSWPSLGTGLVLAQSWYWSSSGSVWLSDCLAQSG